MSFRYESHNFKCKKLVGSKYIEVLFNPVKSLIAVRPSTKDSPSAIEWKNYNDLGWDTSATMKILGTLVKARDEKIFVFEMKNAEAYKTMASPTDENRRVRVPFYPDEWAKQYGQTVDEYNKGLISTFEGVPAGFVSIRMAPVKNKNKQKETETATVETDTTSTAQKNEEAINGNF